jgi:hypothetical protein
VQRDGTDSSIVPLRPENEEAARIFQIVRGQVITRQAADGQVIEELNQVAVWAAIDAYGVTDRTGVFEKVLRAFERVGT